MENVIPASITTLDLDPVERWNVFKRLQELSIPCWCKVGQPLRVWVETPAAALQVWTVVQGCTRSNAVLVKYLENCWQQRVKQ